MEKLTLEHLAPYLPYKLMCQTPKHRFKYGETESLLMTGLDCNFNNEMNVEFLRNDDLEFSNTMKYIKPILRPLSDLTKEITIEGETFIPIIELAKIEAPTFKETEFYDIELKDDDMTYAVVGFVDEFGHNELYFNFNSACFIEANRGNFPDSPRNQKELYKKLYSMHFDLDNLIEKGLAIDINTI